MTAILFALKYAQVVAALAQAGQSVVEVAVRGRDAVQRMVNEGRDPTPEEIADLNALMLANQAIIDAAVAQG